MPKDSQIIQVSFKKTTRDTRLFISANSQEEKSEFVKDALEFYIEHLEVKRSKGVSNG